MSILETQHGKVLELANAKSRGRARRHKIVSIAAARNSARRGIYSAWDDCRRHPRSPLRRGSLRFRRQPGKNPAPSRLGASWQAHSRSPRRACSPRRDGRHRQRRASLADVRKRVGLAGICYVGCQGYSIQDARGHRITLANRDERRLLAQATERSKKSFPDLPASVLKSKRPLSRFITAKPAAPSLRARKASSPQRSRKIAACVSAAARKSGKFSPVRAWINGRQSVSYFRREGHMESLLIYAGDDVGDEPVFARMSGISILVGKRRATAARYSLESPVELRLFPREVRRPADDALSRAVPICRRFVSRAHLSERRQSRRTGGRTQDRLRQLDFLSHVPESGRHHLLAEGFSSDFAQWVLASLNHSSLAEHMAGHRHRRDLCLHRGITRATSSCIDDYSRRAPATRGPRLRALLLLRSRRVHAPSRPGRPQPRRSSPKSPALSAARSITTGSFAPSSAVSKPTTSPIGLKRISASLNLPSSQSRRFSHQHSRIPRAELVATIDQGQP